MKRRNAATAGAVADCASKLKVLADRTRLGVLEALLDGPQHVGQLRTTLDVEQSLLSHHLRVLRQAGLVDAIRDGKSVLYQIASTSEPDRIERAIHLGCCDLSFDRPRTHPRRRALSRA